MQPARSGNTEVFLIILLVLAKVTGRAHQSRGIKKASLCVFPGEGGGEPFNRLIWRAGWAVCHPNYRFSINGPDVGGSPGPPRAIKLFPHW